MEDTTAVMGERKRPKTPFYVEVDGFRIPGYFPPAAYRSARDYKPRSDDLFIVTYPRSGTTWTQHIVALIFREGRPFSSALDFLAGTPTLQITGAEAAENMPRPGAIKFHFPYELTPHSEEAKYIFVARNPKDCCVSFYHLTENLIDYQFEEGEFDDYFELFIEGLVDFGDYFDTLLSWYEHRDDPNVLFIVYEELKRDTRAGVLKIAEFMGSKYKAALQGDQRLLEDVLRHSSLECMKSLLNRHFAERALKTNLREDKDIATGLRMFLGTDSGAVKKEANAVNFVRKGGVGDWRNYFSPMQNARLMKKFRDRTRGTDLYELWKDYM